MVTIPLGVLKTGRIDFSPKLPAKHRRAIRLLGMGTLDKLYLRFDEVFWDEDLDVIGHVGRADRWTGWVNMVPTGIIGQTELDGVLLNWGNTTEASGSAVPEPATAAILALGGLAMLRRRAA